MQNLSLDLIEPKPDRKLRNAPRILVEAYQWNRKTPPESRPPSEKRELGMHGNHSVLKRKTLFELHGGENPPWTSDLGHIRSQENPVIRDVKISLQSDNYCQESFNLGRCESSHVSVSDQADSDRTLVGSNNAMDWLIRTRNMGAIQLPVPSDGHEGFAIAKSLGAVSDNKVVTQFTESETDSVPSSNRLMIIKGMP